VFDASFFSAGSFGRVMLCDVLDAIFFMPLF